jgi:indole-3-glycerol phosphate synthase
MTGMLEKLYAAKAAALEDEERREPLAVLKARAERRIAERRPFAAALSRARGPAIIAEVKRASPSVGLIARNFDPATIAENYERAGVDAISVLTEADHFLGELAFIDVVRAHSARPILRKDFLTTPYQVAQTAAYGADAILLIAAGVDDATLSDLTLEAKRYNLDVVIEVHDEVELERALTLGATIIGINNRDLRTFETDLGVTEHLLPSVPPGVLVISESGFHDPDDTARLHALGARGFLVGEALMRTEDATLFVSDLKRGRPTIAHTV